MLMLRAMMLVFLATALLRVHASSADAPQRTLLLRVDNIRIQDLERMGISTDDYRRDGLLTFIRDTAQVLATEAEKAVLLERGYHVTVVMKDSTLLTLYRRALYGPSMKMPDRYHTYPRVVAFLDSLARAHPRIARRIRIGKTSEAGLDIEALRISSDPSRDLDRPAILFDGCHHSDEVMGAEICLAIAARLTAGYAADPQIRRWIDSCEIIVVPVVNVDGYVVVTEGRDPRWRKNTRGANRDGRRDVYPEGVNLNRQYDFNWAFGGSPDSLSQQYRGLVPFSESEARAMRDLALRERFLLSISYHSQGEVVYYPWSWNGRKAPEDRLLTKIARELGSAIHTMKGDSTYKVEYGAGTVGQTYPWLYGRLGTFDFVVETGLGAHIFPSYEVDGIVNNNIEGAWTILRHADGPGLTGRITDVRTGSPLEATVWFPGIDSEDIDRRTADSRYGRFRRLLEPGRYTLIVSHPGYKPSLLRNVEVGSAGWTTLNVALEPASGK
jgi:hypothetical protein